MAGARNRTAATLALLGAVAALAFAIAFYRATDWTAQFPRDASGLAAGRDFLNFWMAGRAAHAPDPGRYYELATYNRALAAVLGAGYPAQTWSYPPTQLVIAAPFGLLPYRLALLIWTFAGLGALYLTLKRVFRAPRIALFALAAPAALFALMSGQSSFFTAAIAIGGIAMLDKRPLLAGAMLGLLSLKPQLALLLPVALIAGRHWRALAGAAATALAIALATAALFGPEVWRAYLALGLPAQNAVLAHTEILATEQMPTIFMNLHRAGLSYATAMMVQCLFAAAAAYGIYRAWPRGGGDPAQRAVLLLAASLTATPYLMAYDTLALAVACLWLVTTQSPNGRGELLIKLVWWLPFIQMALGHFAVPGPALIAPALLLWATLRQPPSPAIASPGGSGCGVD